MKSMPPPDPDNGFDPILFPDFWIYRNEGGWRWVSNDAAKSSPSAFDSAPHCALNAERTLNDGVPA